MPLRIGGLVLPVDVLAGHPEDCADLVPGMAFLAGNVDYGRFVDREFCPLELANDRKDLKRRRALRRIEQRPKGGGQARQGCEERIGHARKRTMSSLG